MSPIPIKSHFTYETLEKVTLDNGERYYICPVSGNKLYSVTTILSATADKEHLRLWEEAVGKKAADRARKEGTDLGKLVHEHLECYLEDRERPKGMNLIRQMSKRMSDIIINRGLTNVEEIWGIESQLYVPELYAGTSDLIGLYENVPSIIDFKNAKKMRSRDMIDDYFDQICAYGICHDELYGTNIRQGVIFMVSRDLQFETFIIEGNEYDKHRDNFLRRLEKYLSA